MNTFKYAALCLLAQLFICRCAAAISPEVKIPRWHSCTISVSDWSPESSQLSISVQLEAVNTDLREISAKISSSDGFGGSLSEQTESLIKKGQSRTFIFKLTAAPNTNGWLLADLHALPDKSGLLSLVESQTKPRLAKTLILQQIADINKPIQIGRSVLVCLRSDIAAASADELLFKPGLNNESGEYYLWYPPSGLAAGITREALSLFNSGLVGANVRKAEAAGKMLASKLEKDKLNLMLAKGEDETLSIPYKTVIELINADMAVMNAVSSNDCKPLEAYLSGDLSDLTKPFILYNLAVLQSSLNKKKLAKQSLESALKIIPSWPKAKKLLRRLN